MTSGGRRRGRPGNLQMLVWSGLVAVHVLKRRDAQRAMALKKKKEEEQNTCTAHDANLLASFAAGLVV